MPAGQDARLPRDRAPGDVDQDGRARPAHGSSAAPRHHEFVTIGTRPRQHWSFRPVADPAPRASHPPSGTRIRSTLFHQIQNSTPKASLRSRALRKLTLIRRATYDLTGPATHARCGRGVFSKTSRPPRSRRFVDRLLASQQYGEKWGRHWLDVVRYSDTAGDNADYPVPSMFRYRNLVIAAFNKDSRTTSFLRDQIAGDSWPNATTWCTRTRRSGSRRRSRPDTWRIRAGSDRGAAEFHLTIDDTIDSLGKGVLGLTVACARCHDHKFDPFATVDYYALYGIFKSSTYAHAGTEIYPHTSGFVAMNPDQTPELKRYETQLVGLDNRIEDMKAAESSSRQTMKNVRPKRKTRPVWRQLSNRYRISRRPMRSRRGSRSTRRLWCGRAQSTGSRSAARLPDDPRRRESAAGRKGQRPPGAGAMGDGREESADPRGDRQPCVAVAFGQASSPRRTISARAVSALAIPSCWIT